MSQRVRWVAALAVALGGVGFASWWLCGPSATPAPPISSQGPRPTGTSRVALVDDALRVAAASGVQPFMDGNDVWRPGEPLRLFGLPGETIAFQLAVTAGDQAVEQVRVELKAPRRDDVALRARLYLQAELVMARRSGGEAPGASLGWVAGAAPPGPVAGGALPDPLIPLDWANLASAPTRPGVVPNDYPMTVPEGHHRIVWVDLDIPDHASRGSYEGRLVIEGPRSMEAAIVVEVGQTPLPYRAMRNMLFFEPGTIERYVGEAAVDRAIQRLHRHHIAPIVPLRSLAEVERFLPMLDGSLFTDERGYQGPGREVPTDVIVLGAYGSLRDPAPDALSTVDAMLARLEEAGLYPQGEAGPDVFLYAVDEACDSPRGPAWRSSLDASGRPRLERLRVGHTCSEPPAEQPVDLAMVFAGAYDPAMVAPAQHEGKQVWIYNGQLPHTGSFLTDAWPASLRINGWIQAYYGISRWFYWEGAYWTDDNAGGLGPYDPWRGAETFHNQHGDHANGDGVLLYPGHQSEAQRYDLGNVDVAPSFRLKQWRRGIQDGAYLKLARALDTAKANAVAASLVEGTFDAKTQPVFPTNGAAYRQARRRLFELIEGQRVSR